MMSNSIQDRKLKELIETLAGQRGNDANRAVLVSELKRLEERLNTVISTTAKALEDGSISQAQADIAALDVQIQQTLAVAQAANAAADTVQSNLDTEVAALNTQAQNLLDQVQQLNVDYAAAEAAAEAAEAAKTAAETAKTNAQTAATNASSSATAAAGSASTAATKATEAGQSATAAAASVVAAEAAKDDAETAATAASTSASAASASATSAASEAAAANTSKIAAQTAKSSAETARDEAAASETNAESSASQAATSATNAATSATNAANSASAAATSASTASTKATEASQSATSAQTSATNASTSAASASTSATSASTAATNAGESAALAASSQQIAAQITSRGTGVLSDQFLSTEGADNWTRTGGQGTLTRIPNEAFTIGQTWRFTVAAGQTDGLQTESTDAQWRGVAGASAYVVEVDYTLVAGDVSVEGANLEFQWVNTSGVASSVVVALAAATRRSPIVANQMMTAIATVQRPAGFTGTFSFNRLIVNANNGSSLSTAAKTISFHRIAIRAATREEIGQGAVGTAISAAVGTESAARAAETAALANQINTVSADVGDLSASVTSQATALATIDDNLAATYSFRVKAGSSGAQLELIASSDPSGSTSVARISADNILLNGSVSAPLIAANAITAEKIAAGAITSAKLVTGQAVITDTAQIANAVVTTAKIADLTVTTAKIADLTVGTQKITDLAVTTGAGIQGFGTASASCLGGKTVLVWASITAQGMSANGSGWIGAQVYFNGVMLGQYTFGENGDSGFAPIFVRTSQAGTNSLQLIFVQNGSQVTGNLTVSAAFLELKK